MLINIRLICRFLLSEKTSYPFKKYFQSSPVSDDWSEASEQLRGSKRSRSLQPKFSRWQQLNSLVAERHEGDQFVSLNPPVKPQLRPKLPKHSSLAFPPREYDEDGLSDSLKLRIAGAAFGVRKKERQKIDDVFHSIKPRQTKLDNHQDDTDHISSGDSDKGHQPRNKPPPSVGSLQKPTHSRPHFVFDGGDRKGQLILPAQTHH